MLIYLTDQYTKLNLGVILLQTQLRQHLVINKDLAHTYRLVQNEFYTVKNELLDTFEYRVSLESSLKDHKQVCIKFKPLFYSQVKCDMIYSMEAKVGIFKVEIQVKIGCGGEFWQKWVIYVVIKFETSTL